MATAPCLVTSTVLHCANLAYHIGKYNEDDIDENELPQGYLDPSMTEHFKQKLQRAFDEKRVSVICLKSRDPNSLAVKAHGSAEQIEGSSATLELSPDLIRTDAKATEWRAAVAIGALSPNRCLLNTLETISSIVITTLLCYALSPTSVVSSALAAIASGFTANYVTKEYETVNGELFANRISTQEQLAGGIRYLSAQQHAEKAMRMLLEEQSPILSHLYSCPNGDSYLPFNKLSDQIAKAKMAYNSRFQEIYEPKNEEVASLSKLIFDDLVENSWYSLFL